MTGTGTVPVAYQSSHRPSISGTGTAIIPVHIIHFINMGKIIPVQCKRLPVRNRYRY